MIGTENDLSPVFLSSGSSCKRNGEDGIGWPRRMAIKEVVLSGQPERGTWVILISSVHEVCVIITTSFL